ARHAHAAAEADPVRPAVPAEDAAVREGPHEVEAVPSRGGMGEVGGEDLLRVEGAPRVADARLRLLPVRAEGEVDLDLPREVPVGVPDDVRHGFLDREEELLRGPARELRPEPRLEGPLEEEAHRREEGRGGRDAQADGSATGVRKTQGRSV